MPTATLPPPPITQADRARADARQSWDEINQRMVRFAPQSSLPALDGVGAADAALLIETDWPYIVNGLYGPPALPALCNRRRGGRHNRCRPGDREQVVAWYIIPESPARASWAACKEHLPAELPARHWYSVAPGVGNTRAQAAMKMLLMMQEERRRIARHNASPGGDEFAAYYLARLDIAKPFYHARLTQLNGGAYHIAAPPDSLPPLPPDDAFDGSLLWLARGDDRPQPVPVAAAAELADVDIPVIPPVQRTMAQSLRRRMAALTGV